MNRVFVLEEITPLNEDTFFCNVGLDKSLILAHRNTLINKNREINRYVKSFLRKEGNSYNGMSVEVILRSFINHLQNIEKLEDDEKTETIEEKSEPIDNRFEIMDL